MKNSNKKFYGKFLYLMLPIALSVNIAFANNPILISEQDANVSAPVPAVQETKEPVAVQTKEEVKDKVEENKQETNKEVPAVSGENKKEEEITLDKKGEKLEKRKVKKEKKNKNDYSEYLIPEDGYYPVGDVEEKHIKIQGAVSKSEELSLADCLELALNNNPKIQAAYANSSAVKENKVQTIANYTPSLSTQTALMRNKPDLSGMPSGFKIPTYTKYLLGTISLSQLVYDFGVTQNQYTINKLEWENAKQNIESVVNSVVCDVKDAYYNLLYALSAKQVRQETVEQYETMYKQARAFYEIGTRPKVDVTIAAANLADAKANYIEATNAVDLAVSKLNNVMGTPFIEPYVVNTVMPYEATDITMKGAIEIANEARPDLKMAILQMKMADEYVKLAKKTYMPKLSVSADLSMGGRDHFTDTTWYSVGGYFEFPVINPVTITSQIKQAKAEMKQQQYNTKSTVNDIYYEIQTAYVQLNDARERIAASKVAVQQARESFELSQGRYKAGVCDAVELKESQVTYENAKLAYVSNVYTYNSAKASLEKAIGQSLKPVENHENVEI